MMIVYFAILSGDGMSPIFLKIFYYLFILLLAIYFTISNKIGGTNFFNKNKIAYIKRIIIFHIVYV